MNKIGLNYRRTVNGAGVLSFTLILCFGLFWSYGVLKIRMAWAGDQTRIFEDMRDRARQGDAETAASCLDYVVNYYPSGTKQKIGSDLDQMVERERIQAEQEIMACLRIKTGSDLGKSPKAWIEKYAAR